MTSFRSFRSAYYDLYKCIQGRTSHTLATHENAIIIKELFGVVTNTGVIVHAQVYFSQSIGKSLVAITLHTLR